MTSNATDHLKIGLAFSGGGFRAGAFCLGVITYLDKLKISSRSMLEHTVALSTVSGGTITGARYAVGLSRGEIVRDVYKALYFFMRKADLVSLALERLTSDEGWEKEKVKSLINAFADVYDKELFQHAKLGPLLTDDPAFHLKHFSFNSTEFSNAKQFRFQWSERILHPKPGEPDRGIIGNHYYKVPLAAASEIRMADVLAASSCFPGGFEPINFPTDFSYQGSTELKKLAGEKNYPVGLMDGGIVDNQGIEPILLAEERMKRNRSIGSSGNVLDLIIVCDVASPFMESYKASEQGPDKGWRSFTPLFIFSSNTIVLLVAIYFLIKALQNDVTWLAAVSTMTLTISLLIYFVGIVLHKLPKKFEVPQSFMKALGKLLRLKLRIYETILSNRAKSLLKLANEVFLKHVRSLNYDKIYEDESWKGRRIMNAIYELKNIATVSSNLKEKDLPEYLIPSPAVEQAAKTAYSMGTTLWFTPDELEKKNMLNCLIATGQFTCCWNLLGYIEEIKKDKTNTNPKHDTILELEETLKDHWKKFQPDPLWLTEAMNQSLGL